MMAMLPMQTLKLSLMASAIHLHFLSQLRQARHVLEHGLRKGTFFFHLYHLFLFCYLHGISFHIFYVLRMLQLITPLTTFQTFLYLPKTFMLQEKKCSEDKLFMNLFFKIHLSVFDDHHLSFFSTPFSSLQHSLSHFLAHFMTHPPLISFSPTIRIPILANSLKLQVSVGFLSRLLIPY